MFSVVDGRRRAISDQFVIYIPSDVFGGRMELAIVDACGGRFGNTHGSVHIYEVEEEVWNERDGYSQGPDGTLAVLQDMEKEGKAELRQTIVPDDVVTV